MAYRKDISRHELPLGDVSEAVLCRRRRAGQEVWRRSPRSGMAAEDLDVAGRSTCAELSRQQAIFEDEVLLASRSAVVSRVEFARILVE